MTTMRSPTGGLNSYYILTDGFDEYGAVANLSKKWSTTTITTSVLADGRISAPNSNVLSKSLWLKSSDLCQYNFSSHNIFSLGFAFKIDSSLPSSTQTFLEFFQTNVICGLSIKANGSILFHGVDSTSLNEIATTQPGIIKADKWYYIEILVSVSSGTVSGVLYVNNTNVIPLTAKVLTGTTFNGVRIRSSAAFNSGVYFDDLKLVRMSSLVSTSTDPLLGDARITTFVPTSTIDLATTQFTAVPSETDTNHHRPVSGSIPDDDTSYLRSSLSGSSELFEYDFAQLNSSAIIHAISFNNYARKTGVNAGTELIVTENFVDGLTIRSYAVTGSGLIGASALTTDYKYVNTYLTTNNSSDYTRAKLIAGEAGIADDSI